MPVVFASKARELVADEDRLIAVMLGRLEMDVSSCIDAYVALSDTVFHKVHHRVRLNGKTQARFDTAALERAIKNITASSGHDEDALLKAGPEAKCKVYVDPGIYLAPTMSKLIRLRVASSVRRAPKTETE